MQVHDWHWNITALKGVFIKNCELIPFGRGWRFGHNHSISVVRDLKRYREEQYKETVSWLLLIMTDSWNHFTLLQTQNGASWIMLSEDTWGRTSSCMYCSRKGEALRLSTGMLKKPWISFWWRSMVIRWVRPAQMWSESQPQTHSSSSS